MKALNIIGLSLTLAGALILSWKDLRGKVEEPTFENIGKKLLRPGPARFGFPLIAVGVAAQIVAVAAD